MTRHARLVLGLAATLVLLGPVPAAAQAPYLDLQATPLLFGSGATITLTADVAFNETQFQCPYDMPPWAYCVPLALHTSIQITGSNGFSGGTSAWDEWSLWWQTQDAGPGQTLQPTTYTLTGAVVLTYCVWNAFVQDCEWPPDEHVQWGQTQVTVHPSVLPTVDGLSPASGSGLSATFTAQYASAAGAGNVGEMWLWIGGATWPPACWVRYLPGMQQWALIDDAYTGWFTAPLGSGAPLQNSQCAVDTATATASATGNQWTLTLPITFSTGWTGAKEIWLLAMNLAGQHDDWHLMGSWTAAVPPPTVDELSPTSGSGLTPTFTAKYSSAAGAAHVAEMDLWIGAGGAASPCHFRYWSGSHTLGLYSSGWLTGPVGAGGVWLDNGQCAVHTGGVSATATATQWTVSIPVSFDGGWAGLREVWLIAWNDAGLHSGWQHRGEWTVPCSALVTPHPAQLTAASGQTSFSIQTPAGCGWTAPATSDFLTLISSGSGTGPGQVQYAYGANTGVQARVTHPEIAGQVVTVTQAAPPAEVFYYHTDALGSVRLITDGGGAVVATNDYLPFGDDWQATGDPDRRGFAGMERTWHTGVGSWGPLNYAGARYYHSQTGRFTTPDDPIYIDPLNPQTWNLYTYVMNNPLRWVDPSGRQAQCTEGPGYFCGGTEEINLFGRVDKYWRELDLLEFWGNAWRGSLEYWSNWQRQHEAEMARQEQIARECFRGGSCEGLQIMMAGMPSPGAAGAATTATVAKILERLDIQATTHFINRLIQRASRGIDVRSALDAYRNGRLFYNPATGNYIRHSSRTGVSVVTDAPTRGRLITVFEGNPSPTWNHVPWRPGQ